VLLQLQEEPLQVMKSNTQVIISMLPIAHTQVSSKSNFTLGFLFLLSPCKILQNISKMIFSSAAFMGWDLPFRR